MSNPILEQLRFLRDLGIEEVYLPEETKQKIIRPYSTAALETGQSRGQLLSEKPIAKVLTNSAPVANPLQVLQKIATELAGCTRCDLHRERNKIVFGSGNPHAKVVFVGEGPGADEDAQGLPFVGRAGQLLTQMINKTAQREEIEISRDDVYICNVVKCRPPGNRNPEPKEMRTCGPFLERQLEAIQPKAICLLGGTATKFVLQTSTGITKLRGKWQKWGSIPVMPTYHPSFLLRPYAQDRKREAWLDLRALLHFVFD